MMTTDVRAVRALLARGWSFGCNFREDNRQCPDPPAYRAELQDCAACRNLGYLYCLGHRVCVTHAAEARADGYLFAGNDADIVVERIRSAALASPAGTVTADA